MPPPTDSSRDLQDLPDWRISGDDQWLRKIYPRVRQSMDYCIATWDPGHEGAVKETSSQHL